MQLAKILVAVDGSEASMKAADYAIELAAREKSQLLVLHVLDGPYNVSVSSLRNWYTELREQAEKWISDIKEKAEKEGVDVAIEIADHGISTYLSIVDHASKEKVDLIIVGSKGRTGLQRLLLGSVAQGVVTYAACPVLVVK